MKNFDNKKGFTLVEMIMVISVIAILATIAYTSFSSAREQSRDKVRMSSLKELQLALELYKQQEGRYPAMGCGASPNWAGPGPHSAPWGTECSDYIDVVGFVPDLIPALPLDPNREFEDNKGYIYQTNAAGSAYKLMSHRAVESAFVTSYDNEFARCPRVLPGACAGPITDNSDIYAVYSAGAESW